MFMTAFLLLVVLVTLLAVDPQAWMTLLLPVFKAAWWKLLFGATGAAKLLEPALPESAEFVGVIPVDVSSGLPELSSAPQIADAGGLPGGYTDFMMVIIKGLLCNGGDSSSSLEVAMPQMVEVPLLRVRRRTDEHKVDIPALVSVAFLSTSHPTAEVLRLASVRLTLGKILPRRTESTQMM